jgi:hypothetical protein
MRSWVQLLETTSCRNTGKVCVHKTQSGRTKVKSRYISTDQSRNKAEVSLFKLKRALFSGEARQRQREGGGGLALPNAAKTPLNALNYPANFTNYHGF